MIEKTVIDWLNAKLSVPVLIEEPVNPNPGDIEMYGRLKFCVVEKTGSSRTNRLNESTIAVLSYAGSLYEAAELNEEVKEAMDQLIEEDNVTAVRLNSDYAYSKEATKQPRYQAVFDVYHY